MQTQNIKFKIIFFTTFFLVLFGWAGNSEAATINAASCSQNDVQNAINEATTGDIVTVPAGSCTWTVSVSINGKNITLQGTGASSTNITSPYTLYLHETASRVTAINFIHTAEPMIDAEGQGWRIDHCVFNNTGGGAISSVYADGINSISHPIGLIDNNAFINGNVAINGRGDLADMSAVWLETLTFGTADAVYVENNTFIRPDHVIMNAFDGNRAAKGVFRYNTVTDQHLETHSFQYYNDRAFRKWEIYGNISNGVYNGLSRPYRIRGGTGFIFYNTISGDWSARNVAFDNVRSYTSIEVAGQCNGSSLYDSNTSGQSGWPCRDQIGRGSDVSLYNPPSSYPAQNSVPAYLWSNRDLGFTGSSNLLSTPMIVNNSENWIQANRDYYTDGASFNGTSGVGCGALASRPATCTTGVGYWATNQSCSNLNGMVGANPSMPITGTLYKCTSTNTWTAYYTPYTYPHPLAATVAPPTDTTPPGAPTGVVVQ